MVQFFTQQQGRVVGVKKGMRRGRNPVQLQPFSYGRLSYVGRSNLVTVTSFESVGRYDLAGNTLSAGFYVLELLTRCLSERQAEPMLYSATCRVLEALQEGAALAPTLRQFEAILLRELGYGIDYLHEADEGRPVEQEASYRWVPERGLVRVAEVPKAPAHAVPGRVLIDLHNQDFSRPETVRFAKYLYQSALAPLLGTAPLVSREMFRATLTRSPGSG
jgi:DNA repair protein RecO (recombination protein O)